MTNKIDVTYNAQNFRLMDGCDSDEAVRVVAEAAEKALRERFEPDGFEVTFSIAPKHEAALHTYTIDVDLDDPTDFTTERDTREFALDLMEHAAGTTAVPKRVRARLEELLAFGRAA